jgi:N utilization substance protein B
MTATRRQAREWAIQMLTAADLNPPDDVPQFMLSFWEELASLDEEEGRAAPAGKVKAFSEERVAGVLSNLGEIDGVLAARLDNWDLYRLGTVERAVLRMGVWEMRFSDVPKPVVINEAIDLVNWFSGPKSRTLVNAVLDKYGKELKA